MNNKITKLITAVVIGAIGMSFASCTDELDQYPNTHYVYGSYWQEQAQFEMFNYSMANMFRSSYAGNINFWAGELRAGSLTIDLINGSGAVNTEYITNDYREDQPQFYTFGGYYGYIGNLNEMIYNCENVKKGVISEEVRKGLLAMAFGQRAYCYFQMYRMYGGVPLRTEPDVLFGEYDPTKLYKPRATAEETLNFIKEDIKQSIELFTETGYSFGGKSKDYYWSKAASEMLAGEVYVWSAKVATEDHTTANAVQDMEKAKTYFENVVNNYGYKLVDDFYSIWTTPHNTESIFSVCYSSKADGVYWGNQSSQMVWSKAAGASTLAWSIQDSIGFNQNENGTAALFGSAYKFSTKKTAQYEIWNTFTPSPNRYMYYNGMFFQYDEKDVRRKAFLPQYGLTQKEKDLMAAGKLQDYILDFDPKEYTMIGSFFLKMRPSIPEGSTSYSFVVDIPMYRLALAHTYLAEVANYQGNNAEVEKQLNIIRKRAFGKNWNEATYGYKAGSFVENENAIMREKDREFISEGQRWWDLRRLTTVKDGAQTDHFAFQPQGCPGYGLDPISNPWLKNPDGSPLITNTPVLSYSEEYKLLWPLDADMLGSDPLLVQNPGYKMN